MMNSEIFNLVFNNFKSNISSNWTDLREESEFCDVSLACEGGRVEAHKVILSSCSSVIKDLLIQANHPHPLVYLRGVNHMQIKALLDFIYKGEVNIAREDLDDFLEVARELKVKGLAEDDKQSNRCAAKTSKSLENLGFGTNDDNHIPAKVKSKIPTVYSNIIKEEHVVETQNPYSESHEESNYDPNVKMEEQDYYDEEDQSGDGEAFYAPMSYKCEFCDEIVSRDGDDYKHHLRLAHDVQVKDKKVLACPDCFERKEDYMDVKRCQREHKKDKSWKPLTKFECNFGECVGVAFKQKKAFLQHLRRHHRMFFKPTVKPDSWVCIYCRKIYACHPSLRYHENNCPLNPANTGPKSTRGRKPRSEDVYMENPVEGPSSVPQGTESQHSTDAFDSKGEMTDP